MLALPKLLQPAFAPLPSISPPHSHLRNSTTERREATNDLSTDMPQWAVVTVAIIICLALALAVMVIVGAVGRCWVCGRKESTPSPQRLRPRRRRWHIFAHPERTAGNVGRSLPDVVSVETMTLAIMQPPPPVYVHPPQYHESFKAASDMEQGAHDESIGVAV